METFKLADLKQEAVVTLTHRQFEDLLKVALLVNAGSGKPSDRLSTLGFARRALGSMGAL